MPLAVSSLCLLRESSFRAGSLLARAWVVATLRREDSHYYDSHSNRDCLAGSRKKRQKGTSATAAGTCTLAVGMWET
jgi:hypothetical protein